MSAALMLVSAQETVAQPLNKGSIRIATFDAELSRKGPGLMLRDILRDDPQAQAVAEVIAAKSPDILLLMGVDYDARLSGIHALNDLIGQAGAPYPYIFARAPNSGQMTALDMNGDGRRGGPADAQGYGLFAGHGGMVVLSRLPLDHDNVVDFSHMLWADLHDTTMPTTESGEPFPSAKAQAIQRLSSVGHWIVPAILPDGGRINLLAFDAAPPVFDGPEDRNGLRNAAEIMIWIHVLNGDLGAVPAGHMVVLGNANQDPENGEGRRDALHRLLHHPNLQDPAPKGQMGSATADWDDPDPGNLRVDYVLPDKELRVIDSGVFWPAEDHPLFARTQSASRHKLVWVDIKLPD